jgi:hypothetical protein
MLCVIYISTLNKTDLIWFDIHATFLCFDLWAPTASAHVRLCALTVIGPEVNTENRCRHL